MNMFITILELFGISLIPIVFATGIHVWKIYGNFDKFSKHTQYAIIIALFSFSCILGTVFGVPSEAGALINVRDASPIISGLMFGGPVGVAVGFIGGLYRFISVYITGTGAYTQIACSVSTFLAGVFTLIVRKFIFNNHHGRWYYGFFLGILCEDFHMFLVILTHLTDIEKAYAVVTGVVLPMIITNSLAVMFAILIADVLYKEKIIDVSKPLKISTKIQLTLICGLAVAYGVVSSISYYATHNVAMTTNEKLLQKNVEDLTLDVDDLVDAKMKEICEDIKMKFDMSLQVNEDLNAAIISGITTDKYSLSEINLVDKQGKIAYSSRDIYVGFDMSVEGQSKDFNDGMKQNNYFVQKITEPTSEDAEGRMKYAGIRLQENNKNISYIQIGLDEEKYHNLLDLNVKSSANFRSVGNKGFMIVSNSDGDVVSIGNDGVIENKINIETLKLNEVYVFSGKTGDKDYSYYTYVQYIEGYYVIALADCEESDLSSNIAFATLTLTEIFAFLVLYCVLFIVIKHSIVNRIENVGKSLSAISNGDLTVKVHEDNAYEMKMLSDDINATVDSLKAYAEKEQEKMAQELQFAKNIQHSALPSVFPLNNNFRIYANMVTAKAVGGDFYDFYYVDKNHIAIQIADVSGKGIPAAMFMMKSKTIIKGLVESGMPVHLACTQANKKLCEGNDANMFVTAWVGIVDIRNGHVDFVNAGHNPPLIQKEDGTFEYLKSKKGFVFAGIDGFPYVKQSFDIKPGKKIYLYTDGVTEATNKEKELFGEQRLLEACNELASLIPTEMCKGILERVDAFVDGAEQADDITMLCFQLNDKEKENSNVFEAKIENTEVITEFVAKYLHEAKCNPKAEMQINVAIDEIFSNICHYAYKENQEGNVRITVSFDPTKENISIAFEDRGVPYNPLEKADPNVDSSLEDKPIGGLGIFIVKNTMDDVTYENDNGHNILTITKNIK